MTKHLLCLTAPHYDLPAIFASLPRTPVRGQGDLPNAIEVMNLTNHGNVLGYNYVRAPAPDGGVRLERDAETWFTILPSLGVSWSKTF